MWHFAGFPATLELLATKQLIGRQEWPMTLSTIRHCPIGITYFPYYQWRLLDGWQSELDFAHHNNKLRSVKRSVRPWSTSSRESRHESVIITRWRIGHTRLTHEHLLVGEEAPYCEGCIVPLTVVHFLTECPEYFEQRRQCFGGAGLGDPINLSHVLRDAADAVQQVLRYLHLTGLYNAI